MSKIKNLSDLGSLYSEVVEAASKRPLIEGGNKQPDILNTDASMYLPESKEWHAKGEEPKAGEGFGKKEEKLAKGTGPEAAGGFKKNEAKDKQDAVEETDMEKEETEAAKKNEEKEKVEENVDSAFKTPKYKKQTFTMPKSKFQQIYEDAMQKGPFVNEEEMTPIEPAADDTAEIGAEPEMGGEEEACCTHEEAIEMVEKLLKFLKKDTAYDKEHGDLGDEDQAFTGGGEEEETAPMEEAVEAEDLGHPGPGHGAKSEELKDGHKIHKVGSLKAKGKASFEGGPAGQDGAVKKQSDSAHLKDGHKIHTAGDLKVDKGQSNAFEQ